MMMDAQYQQIAREIVAMCPAPFAHATLEASLGDGFSKVALTCVDAGGEHKSVPVSALAASNIDDALVELREAWPTKPPFSTCTFTLSPDGTFKFDVGYGD
ncbi:hypothetical protein ASG29_07210 [Sphingomonas sp. Leaf412]|uniref:hypothetical protein n=1 Tax=Sphingomonas sp. Leaf412 TaxID=1736370 RepID=UPI0006F9776C|nr:hypothetical protein [Sphingomonas sp. Leaf412]KQT31711.1 hypothetical protein ASG29_07210 [Sphingomonas sp. Leaf412]